MKNGLIGLIVLFLSPTLFAQEKSDIGLIFSQDETSRIGLEFRKAVSEQWKLKLGLLAGSKYSYFGNQYYEIIDITDTSVVQRYYNESSEYANLRFGGEHRIKQSLFSIGLDVELAYQSREQQRYNMTYFHNVEVPQVAPFGGFTDDRAQIRRHYMIPGLRFSAIMNVPISEQFTLSVGCSARGSLPIYMGASAIIDPYVEFVGNPPAIFDFQTSAHIAIRYHLRKKKEEKIAE
jgi:hypothetical protein